MVDPEKVRAYIRDRKELNVLLNNKEQFDDDEIEMFDRDCREELILNYPALIAKKNALPDIVIMQGVIGKLMEAVAQEENRNQMTIGDDNVGQIDFSNKSDKYFRIAAAYSERMIAFGQKMCAASFYQEVWGSSLMSSSDYEFFGGSKNVDY